MASNSSIEWTTSTWNPVTGCTKISPGCKNCYAERMAKRLQLMGQENYKNGFKSSMHEHVLSKPLEWKTGQIIFVNSMSDLFHKSVTEEFIHDVFDVMNRAYWHQFQVLTKRPERVARMNKELKWASNIWMGTSVENSDYLHRIDELRRTDAHIKFLSLEPLLGPLSGINLDGIDWAIAGGESGPGARPMEIDWVREIRDECLKAKVPFFFKQWGGVFKKKTGRMLDHRTWDEFPKQIIWKDRDAA